MYIFAFCFGAGRGHHSDAVLQESSSEEDDDVFSVVNPHAAKFKRVLLRFYKRRSSFVSYPLVSDPRGGILDQTFCMFGRDEAVLAKAALSANQRDAAELISTFAETCLDSHFGTLAELNRILDYDSRSVRVIDIAEEMLSYATNVLKVPEPLSFMFSQRELVVYHSDFAGLIKCVRLMLNQNRTLRTVITELFIGEFSEIR